MAKLNYMDRENLLRELEVTEELITIGREATNKLVIADPSVSRQHAWVEKREDGYYLIDKSSSNGSFVNGKKITTQQKLSHNDKVQLGNAQLVFEDEEQVAATFILPKEGLPSQITEPNKTQSEINSLSPDERPTSAVDVSQPAAAPTPKPQPPAPAPLPLPPVVPPPAPAVAPPPLPPPAPRVEAPQVCSSCKKPIESGARFCGFCGAPVSAPAPKPFVPPAPTPPPPSARPPVPPPPAHSPSAQKPPAPPSPSYGGGAVHPLTHGFQPPPSPSAAPIRTGREEYAGFGPRFVAYLIDALIMLPIYGIMILAQFVMDPGSALQMIVALLMGALLLFYVVFNWIILVGKKGYTLGKKFMKLKVVGADGMFPIGIGKALIRVLIQGIGGSICGLTYWMILFDKELKRSWHDRVAGTLVIRQL